MSSTIQRTITSTHVGPTRVPRPRSAADPGRRCSAILVTVTAVSVYIASVDYRSQARRLRGLQGRCPGRRPRPDRPVAARTALVAARRVRVPRDHRRRHRDHPRLPHRVTRTSQPDPAADPITTGHRRRTRHRQPARCARRDRHPHRCHRRGRRGRASVSIGNDWINAAQAFKLLLAYLAAIIYMGVFYCVGAIATATLGSPPTG